MYLISAGTACSVGLNAATACAAIRAGIAKFDELPYRDNGDVPIVGAIVKSLPAGITRTARLVELLRVALADCLRNERADTFTMIPLLVGLSEPGRPGGADPNISNTIIDNIERQLGFQFHPTLSRVIAKGHTAGLQGLSVARQLLRDADVSACIVCATDSYINASSLLWLEQDWRLKKTNNSDGVIPGEAAAAVFLEADKISPRKCNVKISGLGFGYESANLLSDEPLLGLGLAEAARNALADAGIQMDGIDFRLSDVTGESYGFKEQTLALARLLRARKEEFPIWHCADSIGDTGASAGICQLVIAFDAFLKRYAPGSRAMCFTSSISGDRAVAVLQCEVE
jgi:3-oxoacyl-[acyl-carrier-protein] synthase-1